MAQTLARMLDVPFAIVDATTLTEAGYVGEDVENINPQAAAGTDGDVRPCQTGIIYIDEWTRSGGKNENPSITPRCFRRRRAAGAAEDSRRHDRQRTSAGRAPSIPTQEFTRSIPPTSCLFAAALLSAWKNHRTARGQESLGFKMGAEEGEPEETPTANPQAEFRTAERHPA